MEERGWGGLVMVFGVTFCVPLFVLLCNGCGQWHFNSSALAAAAAMGFCCFADESKQHFPLVLADTVTLIEK